MTADVTIKRLSADDRLHLASIAPDVFDGPIDPVRLRAYLAEPGHLMLLALREGEVVGQCAAIIHRHPDAPTEFYIDNLGVTPARRRQGIARRLLDAMLAIGREAGCEEAWLGTEPENQAANRLYEGRGARPETVNLYVYDLRSRADTELSQAGNTAEPSERIQATNG